ncbi:MAG: glycosyltransferase family 4 protein, partial [Planctomycetes bacterium]|nr:glycosyltransferase family 4 protein [Planctomycetota bacterium]
HATDMPVVYNGLDIVVSASTSPEPLGTVVIESMAMARPLIGPNHGGAAEMMDDKETGLLFEPGNAEDLARAILQFSESFKLRKSLGSAAREKALKTFAVTEHVRKIQMVYDTLLAPKIANTSLSTAVPK